MFEFSNWKYPIRDEVYWNPYRKLVRIYAGGYTRYRKYTCKTGDDDENADERARRRRHFRLNRRRHLDSSTAERKRRPQ